MLAFSFILDFLWAPNPFHDPFLNAYLSETERKTCNLISFHSLFICPFAQCYNYCLYKNNFLPHLMITFCDFLLNQHSVTLKLSVKQFFNVFPQKLYSVQFIDDMLYKFKTLYKVQTFYNIHNCYNINYLLLCLHFKWKQFLLWFSTLTTEKILILTKNKTFTS